MSVNEKYNAAVDRMINKIKMSATPVPGFIVGLSGTDSIVTFDLLYRAMNHHYMPRRLMGIHYVDNTNRKNGTWMEREILPWMRGQYPNTTILSVKLERNLDPDRWADMMVRSTHHFEEEHGWVVSPKEETFWVAGTMNATEKELSKYSQMQKVTSIQPIQTFWKSEILELCDVLGVPKIASNNSRIPDCLCGRDELAAENIELIDKLLRFQPVQDESPELVAKLTEWIRTTKRDNGFRIRTPYNL